MIQVLPPRDTRTSVERIKGFRYPAPGSRFDARMPLRTEDELYNINFYARDPRNLPKQETLFVKGQESVAVPMSLPRTPNPGKRKPALLPYDSTGLRTTKTTSWEAVDKSLVAHEVAPDHLPKPSWWNDYDKIYQDRMDKGLPAPMGATYKYKSVTASYNKAAY